MKTTVDVLREAKALLSDPARWGRGGAFGHGEGPYCAVGAIARAMNIEPTDAICAPAVETLAATVKVMRDYVLCNDWRGIAVWNDQDADHAELIDAFDRAIIAESRKLTGEGIASESRSSRTKGSFFPTDAPKSGATPPVSQPTREARADGLHGGECGPASSSHEQIGGER